MKNAPPKWVGALREAPTQRLPESTAENVKHRLELRAKRRRALRDSATVTLTLMALSVTLVWIIKRTPSNSNSQLVSQDPAIQPQPLEEDLEKDVGVSETLTQELQRIQTEVAALEAQRDLLELHQLRSAIRAQDRRFYDSTVQLISTQVSLQSLTLSSRGTYESD